MSRQDLLSYLIPEGPFDEAIDVVKASKKLVSAAEVTKGLAKIVAVCIPRQVTDFQGKAWMATMIEVLSQYPADGILDAMERWPHRSKWLPAPSELIEDAKNLTGWRENLIYALTCAKFEWASK